MALAGCSRHRAHKQAHEIRHFGCAPTLPARCVWVLASLLSASPIFRKVPNQLNGGAFTGPDFSQDYHIFSIIWTSQAISWYVDGIQRFESEQGIPHQSMYLIINSSLGGFWAGNPDASTVLPQYMDIDYARIYQSTESA